MCIDREYRSLLSRSLTVREVVAPPNLHYDYDDAINGSQSSAFVKCVRNVNVGLGYCQRIRHDPSVESR